MRTDERITTAATMLANVRDELAANAPAADLKTSTCCDCGETFTQRRKRYKPRCALCSAVRVVRANDGQSGKSGPVYEKAALAQLEYWRGECQRLGLTPDPS